MSKAKEVLNGIVEQFKSGNIPQIVAVAMIKRNVPSDRWSFLNRLLMVQSGTEDARGFRQWREAERHVVKGARAVYILAPLFKKDQEEKLVLIGFRAVPVFRAEDTAGKPLEHESLFKSFPLIERAEEWGLKVKLSHRPGAYAFYSGKTGTIGMATKEEAHFFHELVHAADDLASPLKPGQDPIQEIVAELGALALCQLVGKDGKKFLGNSYRYIEAYGKQINKTPADACLYALERVEAALSLIMGGDDERTDTGESADKVA